MRTSWAREALCLWVTGYCLQRHEGVPRASDRPGRKPQLHARWSDARWSDALWDCSLTPLFSCGLLNLHSHFHRSRRASQLPQAAFSVSAVLEQEEAHIYFHPEALMLAAPSSTRCLLNPLFQATPSLTLMGFLALCPEPNTSVLCAAGQ